MDECEKDVIKSGLFTGLFFSGILGGALYSQSITAALFGIMFLLTWKKIM